MTPNESTGYTGYGPNVPFDWNSLKSLSMLSKYISTRLDDKSEAEDVLNDVQIAAHDSGINDTYFILKLAQHKAMDYNKRKKLKPLPPGNPESKTVDLLELASKEEQADVINDCFAQLSSACQDVLGKNIKEGVSIRKIAAQMGETDAAIRHRIAKCKKCLMKLLQDRGY